ncbi:WD40-repeat-containing domain protein [Lasiosphaeria ovina]|uniref:WD40-repeat-containing domain protein n=1 Tax=Lasiosphaeria ovina TaxID=92902 RepID=A0AAE0JZA2_9PEZI|nr:WD40-repeat-containing domain protein [Lasiosphaeria ovina]
MSNIPDSPPPAFSAVVGEQYDAGFLSAAEGGVGPSGSAYGTGAGSSATSIASASAARKWDDPPEEEPEEHHKQLPQPELENFTTMVFVGGQGMPSIPGREVQQLSFTPSGNHIVARISIDSNFISTSTDGYCTLQIWQLPSTKKLQIPTATHREIRVNGNFAATTRYGHADHTVFDVVVVGSRHVDIERGFKGTLVELFDLTREKRRQKAHAPLQAPFAFNPDGSLLASVSSRESSRIIISNVAGDSVQMSRLMPYHLAEVTQLRFTPDGKAVVSAARDGSLRLTSVVSGRTILKSELPVEHLRYDASLMEVKSGGEFAATVWGREVVMWDLKSGQLTTYGLDQVRQGMPEGWPLAISPDCCYLVCRTEDGFDVSDVTTGRFRGGHSTGGSPVTAAGFSHDSKWLAIGFFNGQTRLFNIVTV